MYCPTAKFNSNPLRSLPSLAPITFPISFTFHGLPFVAGVPVLKTSYSSVLISISGEYFAGPDFVDLIISFHDLFFGGKCLYP